MPSPRGVGKVKIWILIGQTPVQEFVSVAVASGSFSLKAAASLESSTRDRECVRIEAAQRSNNKTTCMKSLVV